MFAAESCHNDCDESFLHAVPLVILIADIGTWDRLLRHPPTSPLVTNPILLPEDTRDAAWKDGGGAQIS